MHNAQCTMHNAQCSMFNVQLKKIKKKTKNSKRGADLGVRPCIVANHDVITLKVLYVRFFT